MCTKSFTIKTHIKEHFCLRLGCFVLVWFGLVCFFNQKIAFVLGCFFFVVVVCFVFVFVFQSKDTEESANFLRFVFFK